MNKIFIKIINLFAILLLFSVNSFSQKAILDTNIIQVGDQIKLKLQVDNYQNKNIIFPQFEDTIMGGVEVMQAFDNDTINQGKTLQKQYLITSFEYDTVFKIPAFYILSNNDTLETNPIILRVDMPHIDSNFVAQIDTTQMMRIRDIKPPKNTPWTFAEFWHEWGNAILIFILVVLIILFIVYYIKRRNANKPIFVAPKPLIPPHIIANKELNNLKNRRLYQQGKIKKYYTELTDILRVYIEKRFQIPAVESVSYETLAALENIISQEAYEKIQKILNTADMVKFAKANPYEHENEINLKYAFAFVELTKLEDKPTTNNKNE